MEVFIPSFRYEESELERGYTVRCAGAGHARASGWPCAGGQRGLRWGAGQPPACRGRPALRGQASPDLPCPACPDQSSLSLPRQPCPALPSLALLFPFPALSSIALTNPALQSHPSPALYFPPLPSLSSPAFLRPAVPCPAQPIPACPSRHRKDGRSPLDTCCLTRALFCRAAATVAGAA